MEIATSATHSRNDSIFSGCLKSLIKLHDKEIATTDCVNLAKDNGSYQFLVIDNAEQPQAAIDFGLDPNNVIDYDWDDATNNIKTYVEEVMTALAESGADTGEGRFQTS